jgi:hypothetical protein
MIILGDPATFAAVAQATCRNCARPIERRLVIGWIHVEAFYVCPIPPDAGQPIVVASPGASPPEIGGTDIGHRPTALPAGASMIAPLA